MSTAQNNTGGPVAIRGFLVQTLVALLDIASADPPFTEITLEPALGNEQFDFLWKDDQGSHATQVKSTANCFTKSKVEKWAASLAAARSSEHCRLILVGNVPPSVARMKYVDSVAIETKNLNLEDLREQAAHRLALFLEREKEDPGTAVERAKIVHALISELEHLSTGSETLSREDFLSLLRAWIHSTPKGAVKIDVTHFDVFKYAPAKLIGREAETKLLFDAWLKIVRGESRRPHILTFVALGGEGKTSLVAKWVADLAHQDWPGCDDVFGWSFYSQGTREQNAVSSDAFLSEALIFFGDAATAGSAQIASDKGRRLAQLVGERRALLILDGLEPLQYAPSSPTGGELKDQGIAALFKGLATASHGLCVVTTRYSIPDLQTYVQTTAPEIRITRLSTNAGVELLQSFGLKGSLRKVIPGADNRALLNEFERLVEDVKGHALTLNLLGSYLCNAHAGDIRRRDLVKLEEANAEEQGGHAFRVMDAYVRWFEIGGKNEEANKKGKRALAILRLLGLFDRPATAGCLTALLKTPAISGLTGALVKLDGPQRNVVLTRLERARLLTVNWEEGSLVLISVDAHPLLREYFAQRVRREQPAAWRAAHRRLYEHLCSSRKHCDNPTLENLQPLYQAVAHGCQAGLQQQVLEKIYRKRITRGEERYAIRKLGAFGSDLGAVACFFKVPWIRVSSALPKSEQAWLLNEAAFILRALGRLTEAFDPMRAGLRMAIQQKDWKEAARRASNLSELELTRGEVAGALRHAEQSIIYAEREGDAFVRDLARTTYADALHQAGRRVEADARFREPGHIQGQSRSEYKPLYSVQGFQYCDLLLTEAERAAWQVTLSRRGSLLRRRITDNSPAAEGEFSPFEVGDKSSLFEALQAVSERAAQTLKWVTTQNWLLDIALDQLTLSRSALYRAILESSTMLSLPQHPNDKATLKPSDHERRLEAALQSAAIQLDTAVSGLRRASHALELPRGLLSRAWLRSLICLLPRPDESAQRDLDEAWEIAERGPMRLFLADIHLHRARLFFRAKPYPWKSPQRDLVAAEQLIRDCGYYRREQELDDAKRAILGS